MPDQVVKYGVRGLKAASMGRDQTDASVDAGVERGGYQLVYTRQMLEHRWGEPEQTEAR